MMRPPSWRLSLCPALAGWASSMDISPAFQRDMTFGGSFHSPLPSITAPGCALRCVLFHTYMCNFDLYSLQGERLGKAGCSPTRKQFQSTLPLRGATPCHGRGYPSKPISIYAPLAGSDLPRVYGKFSPNRFQSTLPLRGATPGPPPNCGGRGDFNPRSPCGERRPTPWVYQDDSGISIHAPLAGSDSGDIYSGEVM